MAEDTLEGGDALENADLRPPEGEDSLPADNQQPDPVEALAQKMGWSPKDQFRGNPEDWRPADEFILAGKDINKSQSRELRSMRDQVERVSRTTSQLLEDRIKERDEYWQRVHAQAVEEGNVAVADRASRERAKLEQQAPQPANDMPPETASFIEKNKDWFGKDPLATRLAKQIAADLAAEGTPIDEQLRQAERAVRKQFPELFAAPTKQPAAVQTSQSRSATTGSKVKGFADMPAESQKVALDYEKRHGIKRDDFAKSFWADQSRRVG